VAGAILARRINQAFGGPFVLPWEVADLPDEWIDTALGLTGELPALAQGRKRVEERLAKWRNGHPNYGKGRR
jgi:hypothetical protein